MLIVSHANGCVKERFVLNLSLTNHYTSPINAKRLLQTGGGVQVGDLTNICVRHSKCLISLSVPNFGVHVKYYSVFFV